MIYIARIYSLSDENNQVFYIGCTTQPLESRLSGHLYEARRNLSYMNVLKNKRVIDSGFRVSIVQIDQLTIDANNSREAQRVAWPIEAYWIKKYREMGFMLTNDGSKGKKKKEHLTLIKSSLNSKYTVPERVIQYH